MLEEFFLDGRHSLVLLEKLACARPVVHGFQVRLLREGGGRGLRLRLEGSEATGLAARSRAGDLRWRSSIPTPVIELRGPSLEVRLSNFVHGLRSILAQGCAGNLSGRLFRLLRQEAGRRLGVFVEFEDVDFEIRGCDLWQAWRKPVLVENGSGTNGRFGRSGGAEGAQAGGTWDAPHRRGTEEVDRRPGRTVV